jgi:restriction system protein
MRLREFYDRIESCRERYWDIPKEIRIKYGLRQDFSLGFSGFHALNAADDLLRKAFRGTYPIETDVLHSLAIPTIPNQLVSAEELVLALEPLLKEFEARLDAYNLGIDKGAER